MKKLIRGKVAGLGLGLALTLFTAAPAFAGGGNSYAPHPLIDRAISALEAARTDLQDAAHDYCGHRVEALEAVNAALGRLGEAIACQDRHSRSTAPELDVSVPAEASAATAVQRHPEIARAVNALRAARGDLQNAAHDYCGHRVEALNAVNAALEQLNRALKCAR